MNKLQISIIASIVLLSTGCSVKGVDKDFNIQIQKELGTPHKQHFLDKEIDGDKKYIDVSVPTTVKKALEVIGEIDGNIYYLSNGDINDITLQQLNAKNAKKLHIDTFAKLERYIESTTPYTIKVVNEKKKLKVKKSKIQHIQTKKHKGIIIQRANADKKHLKIVKIYDRKSL